MRSRPSLWKWSKILCGETARPWVPWQLFGNEEIEVQREHVPCPTSQTKDSQYENPNSRLLIQRPCLVVALQVALAGTSPTFQVLFPSPKSPAHPFRALFSRYFLWTVLSQQLGEKLVKAIQICMSDTEIDILMLQKSIDHHPCFQTCNNRVYQTPQKGQCYRVGWKRALFEALTVVRVGRLFEQMRPMFSILVFQHNLWSECFSSLHALT